MLRKAIASLVILGGLATADGTAAAASWDSHNGRHAQEYRRDHDDRRSHRNHRDRRVDHDRRWDGGRHYAPPRYYVAPRHYAPPRYYAPPRSYYHYRPHRAWPYWRQSYGRGYRYWDNGRHYYLEPGRPAVELHFTLPLN